MRARWFALLMAGCLGAGLWWLQGEVFAKEQKTECAKRTLFWRFVVVTSAVTEDRELALRGSWVQRVPAVWYGDDTRRGKKKVTDSVYTDALARGEGYQYMSFKMAWVWEQETKRAKFPDWTVRVFDDSFIFSRSLRAELSSLNPEEPVLVGHRHFSHRGKFAYPDGGMPWCVSRGAMRKVKFAEIGRRCVNGTVDEARVRGMVERDESCKRRGNASSVWCVEDMVLWKCFAEAGVKFRQFRAQSWPPPGGPFGAEFRPTLIRSVIGETNAEDLLVPLHYVALHPIAGEEQRRMWGLARRYESLKK